MNKLFEIRMKNGKSFIASTNNKGVCRFSINGNEYNIYAEGSRNKSFTFSVEKKFGSVKEEPDFANYDDLEVVSLQEVVLRNKAEIKFFFRRIIAPAGKKPKELQSVSGGARSSTEEIQYIAGWVYDRIK